MSKKILAPIKELTGATRKQVAAISLGWEKFGLNSLTAGVILERLTGKAVEAAKENKKSKEAFEAFGISVLDAAGDIRGRHENGNWQASAKVQHPSVAILAGELVHAFRAYGGTNYVEFTVTDPASKETYTLSLRRREGREASELVAIMKDALEQIAEGAGADAAEARLALIECGYEVKK